MIYYGWPKIRDPKSNIKDFEKKGYKPGWFFNGLSAAIEFAGGIGIITGVLYWLPALGFGGEMFLGIIWKTTKGNKPFTDWSYDLILLGLCLTLLTFGPGAYRLF